MHEPARKPSKIEPAAPCVAKVSDGDKPELIGSALLLRLAILVLSSAVAVAFELAAGYSGQIVTLTLLAMMISIPAVLFAPFAYSFRSKDRMDIDALANIVGKAMM